jgi:Na+-translocating ferredoxin:NAD+ oxidoreductase RnfG subunit
VRIFLLVAFLAVMALGSARAERYLTLAEARKLCFPNATRFEEKMLRYTGAEARAIEKQSGVRTPPQGNRIVFAYDSNRLSGVLFLDHVIGKHELIDYVVALTPEGSVAQIEILEYRESHGGEIRNTKWRAQFKGKRDRDPLKLNKDIYNISGATMSCRHVTEGAKRVLATFELLVRPSLRAGDSLQHSTPASAN